MSKIDTRERIIQAADQLFYEHGFEQTSFSQIAEEVQISRGNFYYHFKTKDEILDAVIDYRLVKTENMLAHWKASSENAEVRIRSFIDILIMNRVKIKRYGCPVGTLCTELAKMNHVSQKKANKLFLLFRYWLRDQFKQLGFELDAEQYAMHVLGRSQGIATLANTFKDEKFLYHEVELLNNWLDKLVKK